MKVAYTTMRKKNIKLITCLVLILAITLAPCLDYPLSAMASRGNAGEVKENFIAPIGPIPSGVSLVRIRTAADLASIGGPQSSGKYYVLENDIDLEDEWSPIYDFRGTFDGRGYSINNLFIEESSQVVYAGLFDNYRDMLNLDFDFSRYFETFTIKNLGVNIGDHGLYGVAIAGGLIGGTYNTVIENCFVNGDVYTRDYGTADRRTPTMMSLFSEPVYGGETYAGGLVGMAQNSEVINCYSTGQAVAEKVITGDRGSVMVGGLIGGAESTEITRSFSLSSARALVSTDPYASSGSRFSIGASSAYAGGLIGLSCLNRFEDCYARGYVSAESFYYGQSSNASYAGGLIGESQLDMSFSNCYSTSNVTSFCDSGNSFAGGLIGRYAGLLTQSAPVSSCYRLDDVTITGNTINVDGTLLSDEEMKTQRSFAGWNYEYIWSIDDDTNDGFPYLLKIIKRAIIVIPGAGGSELWVAPSNNNDVEEPMRIWVPAGFSMLQITDFSSAQLWSTDTLECDVFGMPLYDEVYVPEQDSHSMSFGTIMDVFGNEGIFTNIVRSLTEKYKNSYEIHFMPYDWRLSTQEAANKLHQLIERNQFTDVVLVCHSMGGIVASTYLGMPKVTNVKIDKFITLGTPFYGAPKLLYTLETGNFLDGFARYLTRDNVRRISQNCPGLYELLPNSRYFSNGQFYVESFRYIEDTRPGRLGRTLTVPFDQYDYSETKSIISKHNAALFEEAERMHSFLYSVYDSIINGDFDAYTIVGFNSKTLSHIQITSAEKSYSPENIMKDPKNYSIETVEVRSGDGTVPLSSTTFNYASMARAPYYVYEVKHAELIRDQRCIQLVMNIIDGKGDSEGSGNNPNSYHYGTGGIVSRGRPTQSLLGYFRASAFCPVTMSVYDSAGELIGTVSSEMIDAAEGHEYDFYTCGEDNDTKIAFIDGDCEIVLTGTGEGTMDFLVERFENDEPVAAVIYLDVPITENTIIRTNTDMTENATLTAIADDGVEIKILPDESSVFMQPNMSGQPTTIILIAFSAAMIITVTAITVTATKRKRALAGGPHTDSETVEKKPYDTGNNSDESSDTHSEREAAKITILTGESAGAQAFILDGHTLRIGKDRHQTDITLHESYEKISRLHCEIRYDEAGDCFHVIDYSTNGTFVGEARTQLKKGQEYALPRNTQLNLGKECIVMLW